MIQVKEKRITRKELLEIIRDGHLHKDISPSLILDKGHNKCIFCKTEYKCIRWDFMKYLPELKCRYFDNNGLIIKCLKCSQNLFFQICPSIIRKVKRKELENKQIIYFENDQWNTFSGNIINFS